VTGHDLFREDSRISINEEVTCRQEAQGLDNKQHAGLFQTVLKERWDELSEEDKAQWNNHAALENTANETKGEEQVFRYVKLTSSWDLCDHSTTCIETRRSSRHSFTSSLAN
jgi:hypothetical protein